MLIKPEINRFAKIKVLGVGGGGSNTVASMINNQQIQGVDFVVINTDAQALKSSCSPISLQIGRDLTGGLGSGGNPEIGQKAAEESLDEIRSHLEGYDMLFITAGMGGGTGTGGAPIVARLAKSMGILSVAVVTRPFSFEGSRRMEQAEKGINSLRDAVDALIVIPNQKLLDVVDRHVSVLEAFRLSDSVLGQGVQGVSDIIVVPGLINVDFADVKSVMLDAGSAMMGIGKGSGETRAQDAARAAVSSPLLDASIQGARGILLNIVGGKDLSMFEVDEAARIISELASADANIIFGAAIDESLVDQVKITVIAAGFDNGLDSLPANLSKMKKDSSGSVNSLLRQDTSLGDEFDIPAFLRQ